MKRLLFLLLVLLPVQVFAQPVPVMKSSVAFPKPGEKVSLSFHVSEANRPLTDYETVHDKKCHLIMVSADYQDFQHIHPLLDKKGSFNIGNVAFKRPGLYYVFFDVTPEGSKQILKRFDFKVQGQGAPLVMKEDMQAKTVDGVTVKLEPMPMPLKAGNSMLHFRLARAGKPVTDLQVLMAAMGHVVALGPEGKPFLHIHPMDAKGDHAGMAGMEGMDHSGMSMKAAAGEVIFHANFPKAGLYKVWGQFQRGGKMLIVPFTVKVG